jgi:hypothetical protein
MLATPVVRSLCWNQSLPQSHVDCALAPVSPAETAKLIRDRFSTTKGLSIEERKKLLAETAESILVQGDDQ